MKSTIILFLMLCVGINTNAQETIEITYESGKFPVGASLYNLPKSFVSADRDCYSIISGDTTFHFSAPGKKGKSKQLTKGVFANKSVPRSSYYVGSNHSLLSTNITAFKRNCFVYSNEDPNPKLYWMDTTKNILNIECQAAMVFNERGDSSTMWIARNIKPGLLTYLHGYVVPGIVMESLDLKYGGYSKAVKVEKTDNKIHFPKDYPQISREEYRRKMKRI
jgi:GLPGLI family protein